MRIVLDTNVVVSALLWAGRPRSLFEKIVVDHVLVTSPYILDELASTLGKAKLRHKLHDLNRTSGQLVSGYRAVCELVTPVHPSVQLRDNKDALVLGTAVAAHASILVSGDAHLLELGRYEGVRILSPWQALVDPLV